MTFLINICIALVITAVVTAVVTYLLSFRYEGKQAEAAPAFEVPAGTVAAPVKGSIVAMEKIPDETFAAGVLGKGVPAACKRPAFSQRQE